MNTPSTFQQHKTDVIEFLFNLKEYMINEQRNAETSTLLSPSFEDANIIEGLIRRVSTLNEMSLRREVKGIMLESARDRLICEDNEMLAKAISVYASILKRA